MSKVRPKALAAERWIPPGWVCVFGSVQRSDADFGRVVGQRAYAIALYDQQLQVLPDGIVERGFGDLFAHAALNSGLKFWLAGFSGAEDKVKDLMKQAPANCWFCSQEELQQIANLEK